MVSTTDRDQPRAPRDFYIFTVDRKFATGRLSFHEMQAHAANGYGVILLNPRGGQGYGPEFVRSILGDYGNKDYQDYCLRWDDVQSSSRDDPQKIRVVGGSYGALWPIDRRHTDRFRPSRHTAVYLPLGSVSMEPATLTIFRKISVAAWPRWVWSLWEMSPLAYADHVSTPTLVLHGENDLRCPQEQGQQFYTALKRNDIGHEIDPLSAF